MKDTKLIAEFIIPEYLREIQVSEKQRPKYYYWDGITIKAKGKKLLQKYINPKNKEWIIRNDGNIKPTYLRYPYFIVGFRGKKAFGIYGQFLENKWVHQSYIDLAHRVFTKTEKKQPNIWYLVNIETKERVIANSTQAGKPKRIIIKGQDMYSGVLNEFTRAKIVNELKTDYKNKLEFIDGIANVDLLFNIEEFPVRIELELIDTIRNHYDRTQKGNGIRWDVNNRAYPYMKTFVDFLVDELVIPDDDRLHVSGEGYDFTPCDKHEDRKLIFRIYKK